MNEPPTTEPRALMPWGAPPDEPQRSRSTSRGSWRDWRAASWALLLWGILFPVLWATVMVTAREDGHHLTWLTAFLFAIVGGGIWATGLVVGAVLWGISVFRQR